MRSLLARASKPASRALVCAALLHAALLASLATLSHRDPPAPAPPPLSVPEDEVAIDLTPATPTPPATATATATPPAPAPATAPATLARAIARAPVGTDTEPAPPSAPPNLIAALPSPSIGLELDAPNPFTALAPAPAPIPALPATAPASLVITSRPLAPTPERARQNVEASLRAAARDHDRIQGLGPEGPILTALQRATFASTAPVEGRAVFDVVANAEGIVERVSVDTCTGARAGWEDVAALAREALGDRPLRVAGAALTQLVTTTAMKVEVVSSLKMPSGHDAGLDETVLGIPIRKTGAAHATKVAIVDPIPKTEAVWVEIVPGYSVKVWVTRWDLLAVHGDPVDIGAKPRRVVHTRLVPQRPSKRT